MKPEITDEACAKMLGWKLISNVWCSWSDDYEELPLFTADLTTAYKYLVPKMRGMGFIWEKLLVLAGVHTSGWRKVTDNKVYPMTFNAKIKDDSPEALAYSLWEAAWPILEKEMGGE